MVEVVGSTAERVGPACAFLRNGVCQGMLPWQDTAKELLSYFFDDLGTAGKELVERLQMDMPEFGVPLRNAQPKHTTRKILGIRNYLRPQTPILLYLDFVLNRALGEPQEARL